MISLFYSCLSWPHLLFYLYYRRKIIEIDQDLLRRTGGGVGVKPFLKAIRLKDYRNVFYFRVPIVPRNIMNILFEYQIVRYSVL